MEEPRCESVPGDRRPPPEKRGDLSLISLFLLQRKTLFGSGAAAAAATAGAAPGRSGCKYAGLEIKQEPKRKGIFTVCVRQLQHSG